MLAYTGIACPAPNNVRRLMYEHLAYYKRPAGRGVPAFLRLQKISGIARLHPPGCMGV